MLQNPFSLPFSVQNDMYMSAKNQGLKKPLNKLKNVNSLRTYSITDIYKLRQFSERTSPKS